MNDQGEDRGLGGVGDLHQSLAQQLRITDFDRLRRRELFGLGDVEAAALRACHAHIRANLDEIVSGFYAIQASIPEIAKIVGDSDTMRRLHETMRSYLTELFQGRFDASYCDTRLRVGMVHSRIGVPSKLYVASVLTLEKQLQPWVIAAVDGDPAARLDALHRAMLFDLHLVMETYLLAVTTEVEAAKYNLERYADSLEKVIEERTRQLHEQSRRDALTHLGNYRAFHEDLRREMARSEREHLPLTLVFLDLNRFKALNDSLGHQAGDAALCEVAVCLNRACRASDLSYRLGGDEFCVILANTALAEGHAFLDRLTACWSHRPAGEGGVTVSVGLAQATPGVHIRAEDLIRSADQSMYRAKARARESNVHGIDTGTIVG
jgi:diguanylate cyclase (GGDEF)-like protein